MIAHDDMFKAYNVYRRCVEAESGVCRYAYQPHLKHWMAIAKLADELNVEVERLILAKFAATPQKAKAGLLPKNIYHPKYLAQQALEMYDPDARLDWPNMYKDMAGRLARSCAAFGCGANELLADPLMPFQAWFRILAMDPQEDRIYARFGPVAKKEADTNIELKNYLKEKHGGQYIERFEGRLQ